MRKIREWVKRALFFIVFLLPQTIFVFADDKKDEKVGNLTTSKIVTGTQKLIQDGTSTLLIIAPLAGTIFIIYFAIRRGAADEMDQKTWNKRITVAISSTVIAVLAAVIINVVVKYYQ